MEMYPQIFDWLNLQDVNVTVIITLIILVAGINLIATLLVIILEKTEHIGIFKTLGMPNNLIRNIFISVGAYVTILGLFWGNLIGLSLCYLQYKYGFIKLDETNYYLSQVPISFDWTAIVLLNIGTLLISIVMMIIPTMIIARVSPIKAIRFK
jgi:lipoprotein-releasing system permease protein